MVFQQSWYTIVFFIAKFCVYISILTPPIVLTDASISELPTEEAKTEESELEQTKTLVDLRNRLNNIRQK